MMLKCNSSQVIASVGKGRLSFLLGTDYWEFDHSPMSVWATQTGLCGFCLLDFGGAVVDGEHERNEKQV